MILNNNIIARIDEIIKDSGKDDWEFANSMEIDNSTLSKIKSGRTKKLMPSHAFRLKNEFNVNLHWLETGMGDKYISPNHLETLDQVRKITSRLSSNLEILQVFKQILDLDDSKILKLGKMIENFDLFSKICDNEDLKSIPKALSLYSDDEIKQLRKKILSAILLN